VVAVVVTWNRRELLSEALAAVSSQQPPPHAVVVVDNASTDGSAELVAERHPRRTSYGWRSTWAVPEGSPPASTGR
jgi:GT2 family glycosyltransferase